MHRTLHTNKFLYNHVHALHHSYNSPETLTPWASIAFNPLDGILQASPYVFWLIFIPCHYLTHVIMLFCTAIWATYIHDTMDGNLEPIMGNKVILVSISQMRSEATAVINATRTLSDPSPHFVSISTTPSTTPTTCTTSGRSSSSAIGTGGRSRFRLHRRDKEGSGRSSRPALKVNRFLLLLSFARY